METTYGHYQDSERPSLRPVDSENLCGHDFGITYTQYV